jgi:putative ABC transport system permease protein
MLPELRYALRGLLKTPRFSLSAILVLALGIGATTAMFSVVYHVCLRPLAYPRPEQLVFVQETNLRRGGMSATAAATFADWRVQQDVFQSMAAAEAWGASLTGDGRPEEIAGLRVSASLLDVLRTAPLIGRGFAPEDEREQNERVVLLSHRLWQRRFAGDASALGRSLRLNGTPHRVIGVMPPDFRFPPFWAMKTELWVPLTISPQRAVDRGGRSLRVFARLKDGVTLDRANAAMGAIASRIERQFPETHQGRGARAMPLDEVVAGPVRQGLVALLGAVAFLLLIACANIANLLLGRASGRRKEIAIRLALGAARGRIVRQLAVESLVLSIVGGAAGVGLAGFLLAALQASVAEASRFTLPRLHEVGLGGAVLLFAFAVSCATGLLFGLVPALQFSRPDLQAALKDGGRGNSQPGRTPLRSLLVAGEIAVSLMLLAGAGLMVRSFARLGAVDAGFDPRQVLTMRLILTGSPHAAVDRRAPFYREALDRIAAVPGVESASGVNHLPLAGDLWTFRFLIEGRPNPQPSETPGAAFRVAFPGYFHTMRIPIVRGRDFTAHDDAGGERVVIVNQTLAQRYFPGEDPIGKRIRLGADSPWYAIAGVVKDIEQSDWGATRGNEFYFPATQNPSNIQSYLTVVVRAAGDPAALAPAIQAAVASLDRDLPVADVVTMQQVVDRALLQPRFSTTLLAAFAGLALALAGVGIYGVMSYDVGRRTPEIGIRMALGARPADVLRSVLTQGAKLTLAGTAVGIAGALLLTRYLRTLLYGVSPNDPLVLAGAAAVLGAVAMLAVWLPARRATRIDPLLALRSE